jgi:tetratricopeptide (TPR) repeat protein
MLAILARTLFCIACTVVLVPFHASAATPLSEEQARAWQEDIDYLAREMPLRHRNLYHSVPQQRFEAALRDLRARVPGLARHQIVVELARIVALVDDGHTNVAPTRDPAIGFRTYPVMMYFFKDGLYIRAASSQRAELVGARVIAIGNTPVDEAYRRVRELIGRDNEMGARYFAPQLLAMPEVLHALGLVEDMDKATLLVEREGKRQTVTLTPLGPARMMPPDTDTSWVPQPGWVDARGPADTGAMWLRRPEDKYWFDYLPAQRAWYVQFNQVTNKPDESIAAFTARLLAEMDARPAERLVLDLRLNRGGNGDFVPAIVRSLIKARPLDIDGRLFVLTGRATFSAAQFLVNDLERMTNAVFVGEPTGGKANSYGDSRKIVLPHSGITVRVSILWWQVDERDHRPWTAPMVAADLAFADYRANRDPALEAALAYQPQPGLRTVLVRAYESGGVAEGRRALAAWRQDPAHAYAWLETPLNIAGYELLAKKRLLEAVDVFEQAVALYPASSNAHDSLASTYAAAGQREAAAEHYRAALRIDPKLATAMDGLQKLGAAPTGGMLTP